MRGPAKHGPSPADAVVGDLSRCRGRGDTAAAAAGGKAAFTEPKTKQLLTPTPLAIAGVRVRGDRLQAQQR